MTGVKEPGPTRTNRLSVVIPTHQTRDLTLACLATVVAQPTVAEVLVVDDASTDGTAVAIAGRYPQVQLLRQEARAGFTAGVNRGLGSAHHDIVLVLNSDTQVLPGSLEALVESFRTRERLGVAGAQLLFPDGTAQWSGGRTPSLPWLLLLAAGLPSWLARVPGYRRLRPVGGHGSNPVDWVSGAAMAVRREVWETLGPLDGRFRFYAQDLDLCSRAKAAGWQVAVLPDFRVVHHQGATIGLQQETVAGADPELLWSDLLCWAHKHRSGVWARLARLALKLGARLRIAGRCGLVPLLPSARRATFRSQTAALRKAVGALGSTTEVASTPPTR